MERPKTLFHYTSLETLALILANRTIRFTRLDRVDDPQEQRSADSRNTGMLKLISCWTDVIDESIPMWREYAGVESGVRIEMAADPFERYSVSAQELRKMSNIVLEGGLGDSFEGLRLPLLDFLDFEYYFLEMARDTEILHKVIYTDDEAVLFPRIVTEFANGGFAADLNALGIHKASAWSYQHEWRYILTVVPVGIRSILMGKAEAAFRAKDIIFDRCDPNTPPYYDLKISDEAFSTMRIKTSPKMTLGNRLALDALIEKYAPEIEVTESSLELL